MIYITSLLVPSFLPFFLFIFSYNFPAVTLILEHATLLLSSGSSQDSALLQAQLQYIQFGLPSATIQFPAAFQEYSDAEFIQFILTNRLCKISTFDVNI